MRGRIIFIGKRRIRRLKKDLIKDIERNGERNGIGHPGHLKGNLSGEWSRTIDDKNRLVYHVDAEGRLYIAQCRTHYGDKR